MVEKELTEAEERILTDEEKRVRFMRATLRDISCKIVCVVIAQPLQVPVVKYCVTKPFMFDGMKRGSNYPA